MKDSQVIAIAYLLAANACANLAPGYKSLGNKFFQAVGVGLLGVGLATLVSGVFKP